MRNWKNCLVPVVEMFILFFLCASFMFATEPFDTWDFPPPRVFTLQENIIYGDRTAELYMAVTPAVDVAKLRIKLMPVQKKHLSVRLNNDCFVGKIKAGEQLKCYFVLDRQRSFSLAALQVQVEFTVPNDVYSLYAARKIAEAHLFTGQREELLGKLNAFSEDRTEQFRIYLGGRSFIPGAVDIAK